MRITLTPSKQQLAWWLALLVLLLARPAAAQLNFSWAGSAASPNLLNQVAEATDGNGNSYVAGVFLGSVTFGSTTKVGDGTYVAKYDASGNVAWVRRIACDGVWAIKADAAGTVWVAGTYKQTGMQPEGSTTVLGINNLHSGSGTFLVQYSPRAIWSARACCCLLPPMAMLSAPFSHWMGRAGLHLL